MVMVLSVLFVGAVLMLAVVGLMMWIEDSDDDHE